MSAVFVVAAWVNEDGRISGERPVELWRRAQECGLACEELVVQSLGDGWARKSPAYFRSGAGPVQALERAKQSILAGVADVVRIRGEEFLRSSTSREERAAAMSIYGEVSIPEGYTRVARAYLARRGWTDELFRNLARRLESNYRRSARRRGLSVEVSGADRAVTPLFRRIDCANPVIDFEGELVLAREASLERLGVRPLARLASVATESIEDGLGGVERIAGYEHLGRVYRQAEEEACVELGDIWRAGEAVVEVYSCYPVVPLGFLEASGWAVTLEELEECLGRVEVARSGGMNFARAPWNQPALRALGLVALELSAGEGRWGLVHGNGGLGGYQGVAILEGC